MQWPNLSLLSSYYYEDVQLQISLLTVGFEDVYRNECVGVRCYGGRREGAYFSSREKYVFSSGNSYMLISKEEVRRGAIVIYFWKVGLTRECF